MNLYESLQKQGLHSGRLQVKKKALAAFTNAQRLSPRITGKLANSLQLTQKNNTTQVTSHAQYAQYVHFGARPHVIRPKKARYLSFMIDGRRIFTKIVHHPGYRGNPWVEREFQKVFK